MPKKASWEDLCQMFEGSVCIHKNKPYLIKNINGDNVANCTNLLTQRQEFINIDEENFTAPTQRLGYINVHGGVIYASRIPIRRYKVGLSKENTVFDVGTCNYHEGAAEALRQVKSLSSIELGDCIMGKYPTLQQAIKLIVKGSFAVAFDRQFALQGDSIYYKRDLVGKLVRKAGEPTIIFKKNYEHLEILLDGKYETTLSASSTR
jgi:hypothetical protein